jgi:hypothetical protein
MLVQGAEKSVSFAATHLPSKEMDACAYYDEVCPSTIVIYVYQSPQKHYVLGQIYIVNHLAQEKDFLKIYATTQSLTNLNSAG